MKLKDASIGIRKAAAMQGMRSGEFTPIFDSTDGPDKVLGTVENSKKKITITSADWQYADSFRWDEI